jgi:hypothetical protein
LEVLKCIGRVVSKDAIDATWIETKYGETSLKVSDIIASKHRISTVKESITEVVTCFDKSRPGPLITHTRNRNGTPFLEGLKGELGRHAKISRRVGAGKIYLCEPKLQVKYGSAGCTPDKRQRVSLM